MTTTLHDSCISVLESYLLPTGTMGDIAFFSFNQEFYTTDYPLFSFIFNFPWCASSFISLDSSLFHSDKLPGPRTPLPYHWDFQHEKKDTETRLMELSKNLVALNMNIRIQSSYSLNSRKDCLSLSHSSSSEQEPLEMVLIY